MQNKQGYAVWHCNFSCNTALVAAKAATPKITAFISKHLLNRRVIDKKFVFINLIFASLLLCDKNLTPIYYS